MTRHLSVALTIGALLVAPAGCGKSQRPTQTGASAFPMGVNVGGPVDYAPDLMLADAMKTSRPWGSPNTPWDVSAPADANGWPTGDAGVVVMTNQVGIGGTYQLKFTGKATVTSVGDSTVSIAGATYDAASNTSAAQVIVPDAAVQLILSFQATKGGVKNVTLLRPGHTDTDVFNKAFLAQIAPFGIVRFMDYLATNGTAVANWADRSTPASASWQAPLSGHPKGGSYESIIQFANQTGKDVWINVPYSATDDFVLSLARLFKAQLDPARAVYIELSNEVWNGSFPQFHQNLTAANAEVAAGGSNLNSDGDTNQYDWALRLTARRIKQISDIFRTVYGDAGMGTQVRPMLAGQTANPDTISLGLQYIETAYGPPGKYLYGISGANYFNLANDTRTDLTADQIFSELPARLDLLKQQMAVLSVWAHYYKLKNVAYEGGPHLIGSASLDAKIAANRDPRMGALLKQNFQNWYGVGGDTFIYYSMVGQYTQYGSWGLNEHLGATSPKLQAVLDTVAGALPPTTLGVPIPATIPALNYVAKSNNGYPIAADNAFVVNSKGGWVEFALIAPSDGAFTITVTAKSVASAPAKVNVVVDSDVLGSPSAATTALAALAPATATLSSGLHVLRLAFVDNSFEVSSVNVATAVAR